MLSQRIESFTCNVTPDRDHVIVAPRGDLDMATVGFAFALEPGPPVVQRIFELAAVMELLPFRARQG